MFDFLTSDFCSNDSDSANEDADVLSGFDKMYG